MGLREKIAIKSAKLASKIIQKTGMGNGSVLPGRIARLLAPDILAPLSRAVRGRTIVTLGTNGKTTSNNLLCKMLEDSGEKVVCNRFGANMENGILSAYVLAVGEDGTPDADYACIEVDEFAAEAVLSSLKPDCILLTNVFRDQLDRYGELDILCDKIRKAVTTVPEAVLVINGDDIFSYALACGCPNPRFVYGISENAFREENAGLTPESLFCRFCGNKLDYLFFHYGHLGVWRCPRCGRHRPLPSCTASDIRFEGNECRFLLDKTPIAAGIRTAHSVYNILSAYAALRALNISPRDPAGTIRQFDFGNGRETEYLIEGARVHVFLIKNPVSFQQKLALLQKDPAPKDIILQINDNPQDGRDVSWLWDVDFHCLHTVRAATITAAGLRRYDVELRLKYEDIPCACCGSAEACVKSLSKNGTGNIYILVNYSGLHRTNRMLRRMAHPKEPDSGAVHCHK